MGKYPHLFLKLSLCQNFLIFLCCKQDFCIYSFLIHSQWRECLFWCSVSKNNKTAIAALSEKHCQVISSSQCNFKAYVCLSERHEGLPQQVAPRIWSGNIFTLDALEATPRGVSFFPGLNCGAFVCQANVKHCRRFFCMSKEDESRIASRRWNKRCNCNW